MSTERNTTEPVDRFDLLMFLPGIAMGLAAARIFEFIGNLLAHKPEKWPSPVHILWIVTLLIFILESWYGSSKWKKYEPQPIYKFLPFSITVLYPLLIYLIAVLLCPDFDHGEGFIDLDTRFITISWWFYILSGGVFIASAIEGLFIQLARRDRTAYPHEIIVRVILGLGFPFVTFLPSSSDILTSQRDLVAILILVLFTLHRLIMSDVYR